MSRYCVACTAALTFAWKFAAASASARDFLSPSALPRYGGGSLSKMRAHAEAGGGDARAVVELLSQD